MQISFELPRRFEGIPRGFEQAFSGTSESVGRESGRSRSELNRPDESNWPNHDDRLATGSGSDSALRVCLAFLSVLVKNFTVKWLPVSGNVTFPAEKPQENTKALLSPEQKRELVRRVIHSQAFSRTPAMRAFLQYVTENAILGRIEKLKEQTIGTEVLGRSPDYNPTDDNIVRVRAHELRGRLDKYFASEGSKEPFVITIPRGAYAPEFVSRPSAGQEEVSLKVPSPEELPSQPAPLEPYAERSPELLAKHWLLLGMIFLVAVAGTAAITRLIVKSEVKPTLTQQARVTRDFWGQFFERPNEELKVVYADTSFALWQDLNGKALDLGDYLNRKYLDVQANKLFNVVMRRVTTPADMTLAVHLATLASEFGGQETPQFARDADSQFFHQGNLVLIGSHRSNPWVTIYEPSLNFQLEQDPQTGAPMFRNRSPQTHEDQTFAIPAMYDTQKTEEKTYKSYGVVALLKGCGDHGLTVLLEGLNTQATQAAGDLVTDPQRLDILLRSIGHQPGTSVPPFEALFQITSMPGGYDNPRVIAYRLRTPEGCTGG